MTEYATEIKGIKAEWRQKPNKISEVNGKCQIWPPDLLSFHFMLLCCCCYCVAFTTLPLCIDDKIWWWGGGDAEPVGLWCCLTQNTHRAMASREKQCLFHLSLFLKKHCQKHDWPKVLSLELSFHWSEFVFMLIVSCRYWFSIDLVSSSARVTSVKFQLSMVSDGVSEITDIHFLRNPPSSQTENNHVFLKKTKK